MLFKVVDQFPVNLDSFMGLQVQIVENQVEIFDEGNERSCFLFLVHGFQRTGNDPLLNLVIADTLEDEGVKLNKQDGGNLDGLDAFKDFEHFISINQRRQIHKQVKEFLNSYQLKKNVHYLLTDLATRSLTRLA
jgi:hypothetical protein